MIKFLLKSIGNEGIYDLCEKLGNYKAYATSVFGMIETLSKKIEFFSGTIDGTITKPTGVFGFGWDPIFIPEGTDKTFAEMKTVEEKNKFSMRFKALQKIIHYIKNQ